jgi:hypothetical protein
MVLRKRSSSQTPQMLAKVISSLAKLVRSTIAKPFPAKKAFMLSK